ncbi:MAG TPA: aldolase/citrate lyase family protein [Burkholderiales bacterium]|nr:aldolase/citrate lyase family protein [Burkholderiales bacterium]
MRFNRLKKLWREGKPAVGGWCSIPHASTAEFMAHTGLDWLCVDMQHGMIDYSDAVNMLTAISTTDVTPIVRVPWNEPAMIMKVLDAGAYGVIVPMVSNRADAERAVAACRYPPAGMRSNGPNRVLLYAGTDYQKHANEEVACVVMVETAEGIEKLEEIASTPGVDAIYIGPTDLALALGLPPVMDNDEPKHVETVNRILDACKRHGKIAGIHTASSKFTQRYIDQGFRMVMLGTDRAAMVNFMKAEVGRLTGWTPMKPVGGPDRGGY